MMFQAPEPNIILSALTTTNQILQKLHEIKFHLVEVETWDSYRKCSNYIELRITTNPFLQTTVARIKKVKTLLSSFSFNIQENFKEMEACQNS
jgi:hypothetical protein